MSDQFNPYQLPVSGSLSNNPYGNGGRSCWAEGKHLVMPLGQSVLPLRCIRCNAPAEEPIKNRVFCWHHPAWYLLTFVVIYPVIALFIRKKVYVQAGLCAEHQRKRTRAIFICRLVFFAGIMAMIFSSGIAQDADFVFMTGLLTSIISFLAVIIVSRILIVAKITDDLVYFKKCSQEFLDSL